MDFDTDVSTGFTSITLYESAYPDFYEFYDYNGFVEYLNCYLGKYFFFKKGLYSPWSNDTISKTYVVFVKEKPNKDSSFFTLANAKYLREIRTYQIYGHGLQDLMCKCVNEEFMTKVLVGKDQRLNEVEHIKQICRFLQEDLRRRCLIWSE